VRQRAWHCSGGGPTLPVRCGARARPRPGAAAAPAGPGSGQRTRRANGSLRTSRSVLFWNLRISFSARVPGR
jgi:hypothetical protein